MTTNEGVLRRWSRRKQAANAAPPASPPEHDAALATEPPLPDLTPPDPAPPDLPPPDLPPIESLGIASDYTAFLQKGVTAEVQRLALQRAWQSDERIAGFRGMAEYAWDFNTPEYGRLWAADDVLKLVQQVLAPPPEPPPDEPPGTDEPVLATGPSSTDATLPSQADPAPHTISGPPDNLVATAEPAVAADALVRRHGSALPS